MGSDPDRRESLEQGLLAWMRLDLAEEEVDVADESGAIRPLLKERRGIDRDVLRRRPPQELAERREAEPLL